MTISKLVRAFLIVGLVALFLISPQAILAAPSAQTPVSFSDTELENRFPVSLTFSTHVQSSENIEKVHFFFYVRNSSSITRVDLEISSAKELDLTHKWVTAKQTIAPSTPIFYYWQVTLENGEMIRTDETLVYYDDTRFDWQVRELENISLWWHDRPASFGEKSFDIVMKAFNQQKDLFGIDLDYPIRIIIYNNKEEYAARYDDNVDLIGGSAFPHLGITTQIVRDNQRQDEWLNDVIPHEISHLYFSQATNYAISYPPSWLDEGVAQYHEFKDQYRAMKNAEFAIRSGKYISLRGLTFGFGYDEEEFGLAYDKSISAVSFLIEKYREEGLINLLAAYKSGQQTNEAFPSALGITFEDFEFEWLASLGVPDGMYSYVDGVLRLNPIPTPTPMPTLRPLPTSVDRTDPNFSQGASPLIFALACCGNIALTIAFLLFLRQDRKA